MNISPQVEQLTIDAILIIMSFIMTNQNFPIKFAMYIQVVNVNSNARFAVLLELTLLQTLIG